MELASLAAKPKLIELTLDSEAIRKEYNESLTFWTWDRVPLDTFMKLANADENNAADMIDLVRTLLLDAKGKEILAKGVMLPTQVLTLAIAEIVGKLGKF